MLVTHRCTRQDWQRSLLRVRVRATLLLRALLTIVICSVERLILQLISSCGMRVIGFVSCARVVIIVIIFL